MGGVSLPSGFGGMMGGAMPGFGGSGYGGGQKMSANTTEAVSGPNGTLKAYDPNTMSKTLAAPEAPKADVTAVGMSNWGVPDFVKNWLQSGGSGPMPTSNVTLANNAPAITQLDPLKPKDTWVDPSPQKTPPPKPVTATKTTPTKAAPAAQTGVQGLQMHGPWEGANNGPLFVNDQWQGGTGTSQPVATPALGSQSSSWYSQFSGPVWTDPKTGFVYSDPQGQNQMFIGGDKTKPFQSKTKIGGVYY